MDYLKIVVSFVLGFVFISATKAYDCSKPPPFSVDFTKCCTLPDIFPKNVIEPCDSTYKNTANNADAAEIATVCGPHCYFNSTNPPCANRNTIYESYVRTLFTNYGNANTAWKSTIQVALDKCFQFLNQNMEALQGINDIIVSKAISCNIKPSMFMVCTFSYFMVQCPTRTPEQQAYPLCSDMTAYVKQCSNIN